MAKKKFDSMSWFNANGVKPVVTVSVPLTDNSGGRFKFKLQGELSIVTAKTIADLAGEQDDDIKVSMPKLTTGGGIQATRSKSFDGETVGDMVTQTEEHFTGTDDGGETK